MKDGITKVYSIVDPETLLALFFKPISNASRIDITDPLAILQIAAIPLDDQIQVTPHTHKPVSRETLGTDEAWVVMTGSILVNIYDLDEKLLGRWTLDSGSLALTMKGGHGFTSLESGTLIYEFKNGPYWGPSVDKLQIQQ